MVNATTNALVQNVAVSTAPYEVTVSSSGDRVFAANYSAGTVSVINTSTNAVSTTISGFTNPMALATSPRMLLLDEPMAGMGREESERMTRLLRQLKARETILLVEHDMDVVFALADRITVLVYGRAIACGTPDEIRANPEVRGAYLGEDDAA